MINFEKGLDINPVMLRQLSPKQEIHLGILAFDELMNYYSKGSGGQQGQPGLQLIRMKGDAMIDAHIPDDAQLIVESCHQPHSNNIVLALVNGEFMVRRYLENSSGARLMPANLKYEPIPLSHGTEFSIRGKVIRVLIDIDQ